MFSRSGYSKFDTESEHGEGNLPAIQFLGVGRMNDYPPVLIATYSHHSSTDLEIVRNVLQNLEYEKYYTLEAGEFQFSLCVDHVGLIYIMINLKSYPQRCAYMCLEEFQQTFQMKFSQQELLLGKENSFTKRFKDQFRKLCLKYNNVADVDAIASAKKKVEGVKLIMEKNIELTLQNCVKIESIEKATDDLVKKAEIFKISAVNVKSRMWWKNIKTKVIIGCVLLILLALIIGILSYFFTRYQRYSHNDDDDQSKQQDQQESI